MPDKPDIAALIAAGAQQTQQNAARAKSAQITILDVKEKLRAAMEAIRERSGVKLPDGFSDKAVQDAIAAIDKEVPPNGIARIIYNAINKKGRDQIRLAIANPNLPIDLDEITNAAEKIGKTSERGINAIRTLGEIDYPTEKLLTRMIENVHGSAPPKAVSRFTDFLKSQNLFEGDRYKVADKAIKEGGAFHKTLLQIIREESALQKPTGNPTLAEVTAPVVDEVALKWKQIPEEFHKEIKSTLSKYGKLETPENIQKVHEGLRSIAAGGTLGDYLASGRNQAQSLQAATAKEAKAAALAASKAKTAEALYAQQLADAVPTLQKMTGLSGPEAHSLMQQGPQAVDEYLREIHSITPKEGAKPISAMLFQGSNVPRSQKIAADTLEHAVSNMKLPTPPVMEPGGVMDPTKLVRGFGKGNLPIPEQLMGNLNAIPDFNPTMPTKISDLIRGGVPQEAISPVRAGPGLMAMGANAAESAAPKLSMLRKYGPLAAEIAAYHYVGDPIVEALTDRWKIHQAESAADKTIGYGPSMSQRMQLLMTQQYISPMQRAENPQAALAMQQQQLAAANQQMGLAPGDTLR